MTSSPFPEALELFSGMFGRISEARVGTAVGGAKFELDADAYRRAYNELYDVYKRIGNERNQITEKAGGVAYSSVSSEISGIETGAAAAQHTVVHYDHDLTHELKALQGALAVFLNTMHKAWDDYLAADTSAADAMAKAWLAGSLTPGGWFGHA